MRVEIYNQVPTGEGVVVEFRGYDNADSMIIEDSVNFRVGTPPERVMAVLSDLVEEAAKLPPAPVDLSALVGTHDIDPDRRHPLAGITDPTEAKAQVSKLIADRMEKLVQQSGLVLDYSPAERDTWARQFELAGAYLGGSSGGNAGAFITAMADTENGETEADIAGDISVHSQDLLTNITPLLAHKHKLRRALAALADDVATIKAFYDAQVTTWSL